ncbi:hypothetical protein D9758_013429 [Tetrapyrgos nigripes]|uniref:Reverse transcriptase Ty1/copia-type domain-containing protein n=1 Tax=Tetrapyrgos nigripes TaxID=182062 RepID=A0A8H5FNF0_9AGAR|nr:hypothetical protein D9758_013429 [Tetrapyrgos nigripes]
MIEYMRSPRYQYQPDSNDPILKTTNSTSPLTTPPTSRSSSPDHDPPSDHNPFPKQNPPNHNPPSCPTRNPRPPLPPPSHRSAHLAKPTEVVICSAEYTAHEEDAKAVDLDWANDNEHPTVNYVDIQNPFDPYLVLSVPPLVLASEVKSIGIHILHSFKQAAKDWEAWRLPMAAEVESLQQQGTWELVNPPEGIHIVNGIWVYNVKVDGEGNVIKRKAHWCAQGDTQIAGLDYDKGWAMVVHMDMTEMTKGHGFSKHIHIHYHYT